MARKIAILGGTGPEGLGLANRLARAGEHIVIGSREAPRAQQAAQQLRGRIGGAAEIDGADNAAAAAQCEVAVLTVPFSGQAALLKQLKSVWKPGTVVIDTTVPLAATVGGKATRVLGVPQGSAAQQAAEMAPEGVRVVSALHTVSAPIFGDLDHALDEDVLVCGDRRADKREAAALIERIPGLRCVDCGRLEMARITESLTALLISVNGRYKTHAGIRLTGLDGKELWPPPPSSS